MKPVGNGRARSPARRLLADPEEDPLATLANLFDAAMVFAVALLVAFAAYSGKALPARSPRAAGEPLPARVEKLEHYRPARRRAKGPGRRLGVAYRLASGEVVYVPDAPAGSEERRSTPSDEGRERR